MLRPWFLAVACVALAWTSPTNVQVAVCCEIRDGEVEKRVNVEEFARTGSLGTLTFNTSGWFLVRAIAENPRTFRFASTAPFYVEVGDAKRRVSKSAAQFLLEWVKERAARVKLEDAEQRGEVLKHHTAVE